MQEALGYAMFSSYASMPMHIHEVKGKKTLIVFLDSKMLLTSSCRGIFYA